MCLESIWTTPAGAEDIMMSRTVMNFTFPELKGKKLYLATNFNEDVFDVGTHTRGTKLIFF